MKSALFFVALDSGLAYMDVVMRHSDGRAAQEPKPIRRSDDITVNFKSFPTSTAETPVTTALPLNPPNYSGQ